jgi:hypothetical protein
MNRNNQVGASKDQWLHHALDQVVASTTTEESSHVTHSSSPQQEVVQAYKQAHDLWKTILPGCISTKQSSVTWCKQRAMSLESSWSDRLEQGKLDTFLPFMLSKLPRSRRYGQLVFISHINMVQRIQEALSVDGYNKVTIIETDHALQTYLSKEFGASSLKQIVLLMPSAWIFMHTISPKMQDLIQSSTHRVISLWPLATSLDHEQLPKVMSLLFNKSTTFEKSGPSLQDIDALRGAVLDLSDDGLSNLLTNPLLKRWFWILSMDTHVVKTLLLKATSN